MKINKAEAVSRGCDKLLARLKAQLTHGEDEESDPQFDDAEAAIDRYLQAAEERQTDMPTSEDLAFACSVLLLRTNTMEKHDIDFLGTLCAPELGIDMFGVAPRVAEIKARAMAGLEQLAKQHMSVPAFLVDDDSIPF